VSELLDTLRQASLVIAELAEGRPTGVLMSSASSAALKAGTLVLPAEVEAAIQRYACGPPALTGISVYIDETCEQPRLDWAYCPVCHPDQPEWAQPEHCPTHKPTPAITA
jgi:hypothetical protein